LAFLGRAAACLIGAGRAARPGTALLRVRRRVYIEVLGFKSYELGKERADALRLPSDLGGRASA
jgi:hypothetical protein